jgi:hypothetical protein
LSFYLFFPDFAPTSPFPTFCGWGLADIKKSVVLSFSFGTWRAQGKKIAYFAKSMADEKSQVFLCGICAQTAVEPCMGKMCKDCVFCRGCLGTRWVKQSPTCPKCLVFPGGRIQDFIFYPTCPNQGCVWVGGSRAALKTHLSRECVMRWTSCSACGRETTYHNLQNHYCFTDDQLLDRLTKKLGCPCSEADCPCEDQHAPCKHGLHSCCALGRECPMCHPPPKTRQERENIPVVG